MKFAILVTLGVLSTGYLSGCTSTPKSDSLNREPQSAASSSQAVEAMNRVWEEKLSDTATQTDFRAELQKEFSRRVRTLSRPVSFYHYGGRGNSGLDAPRGDIPADAYTTPLELRPPEAKEYFKYYSSLFRVGKVDSQVGPGVYAAVDPVQSESYAKAPWMMLEILAPTGTRYLDLRPIDGLLLSKEFVE